MKAWILITIALTLFWGSCFLAQNNVDGSYRCSWWHLHKHPNYSKFCKEQAAKYKKRHWDN